MNEAKRVLVVEAQTDTVGLWTIIWDIEQEVPTVEAEEVMKATLAVVREALTEKSVVAGQMVDQDEDTAVFVSWDLSVNDVIARIEQEWILLARTPFPGEIACFVVPSAHSVTFNKHPMGKGWLPP